MQCAEMQGSTKAATVLDPSPSRFANALQISSTAVPPQILLVSGESSINESSRQEGRRQKKSSWIRRLKPRDGQELSKGGSAEASLEMNSSEKGSGCERMDTGAGIVQPGWFLQKKAANSIRTGGDSVSDAKRQKMRELKDLDVVESRRSASCQEDTSMAEPAKSLTSSAIGLPSNAGFGPWVSFSRKQDMNPESILGSKGIVGTATTCGQELSRDSQRNFCSAFTSTNPVHRCSPTSVVGEVTSPAIFSKSPLSPVHSKVGLPPRPPSQKSPGFHPPSKVVVSANGVGRGGLKQFAQDVQPNRPAFERPSNSESKHSAGAGEKRANELAEAAVARFGSLFQKPCSVEQSSLDIMRDHGKGSSECGQQSFAVGNMGKSILPCRQARQTVAERTQICEDTYLNRPRECASGPICTHVSTDGMDLHLTVSAQGLENSKSVLKNGTANAEPNKTSVQSPSGSSYGTSTCEKADASVSTSASLPWEMFIETAGASRIAREQFVETYNRARDELKNQRNSQRMSRARAKQVDGGPMLTLGPGDTTFDEKLRRQSLKHEQHVAGHPQTQGIRSTNPDHIILPGASTSKEQHLISHVESKGPAPTFAKEPSGLIRSNGISSKFETAWKQGDAFRVAQSLPEGQLRSNVNNVLQTVEQQGNGQIFPNTSSANTRELASKLYEGNDAQAAASGLQLDDRRQSASAAGKSSQEHSIARINEKPLSRPQVWLQRWHPTGVYNFKSFPDAQVLPSDGKRSDSVAIGLKKIKEGNGIGVCGRSRGLDNVSVDKEKGVKSLKSSPSKVLPSAAAMAIVGTAARQFCATQPQRKGSFAFWSGFGMPPPRKVEPVQEKGKAKMFVKEDTDMPNC